MSGNKMISQMDAAAAALGAMEVHVNNAGTDKRVSLTQIRTFCGTYSTTEQVCGKWIDENTIYCRTWTEDDGSAYILTDLHQTDVDSIINAVIISQNLTTGSVTISNELIANGDNGFYEGTGLVGSKFHITVWYTKP